MPISIGKEARLAVIASLDDVLGNVFVEWTPNGLSIRTIDVIDIYRLLRCMGKA